MLKFNRAVAFVIAAGAVAMGSPAIAGDCPTGQERANPLANAPTMPKGVTDTVIGSIDLGTEIGVWGRLLRTRRLVVEPGGIVPMHNHAGRTALIITVSDQGTEPRSTCSVRIFHRSGNISGAADGIVQCWR